MYFTKTVRKPISETSCLHIPHSDRDQRREARAGGLCATPRLGLTLGSSPDPVPGK